MDSQREVFPPILPPPSLSRKRYSECQFQQISSSTQNKNFIHQPSDLENSHHPSRVSPLSSILDRAQSCHSLVANPLSSTFRRQASNGSLASTKQKRFPTTRIDPAPLLPARSASSLPQERQLSQSEAAFVRTTTNTASEALKSGRVELNGESDYWCPQSTSASNKTNPLIERRMELNGGRPAPKPATPPKPTLAKLKTLSQMDKNMRYLLKSLASADLRTQLALWMTEEDCRIFRIINLVCYLIDIVKLFS